MAILVQYEEKDVLISHIVADKELHTFILKLVNKGLLKETKTNQKIFHALP